MFHQLLTPVGGSLALSFLVAAVPIFAVVRLLGGQCCPGAPPKPGSPCNYHSGSVESDFRARLSSPCRTSAGRAIGD